MVSLLFSWGPRCILACTAQRWFSALTSPQCHTHLCSKFWQAFAAQESHKEGHANTFQREVQSPVWLWERVNGTKETVVECATSDMLLCLALGENKHSYLGFRQCVVCRLFTANNVTALRQELLHCGKCNFGHLWKTQMPAAHCSKGEAWPRQVNRITTSKIWKCAVEVTFTNKIYKLSAGSTRLWNIQTRNRPMLHLQG